MVGDGRARVQEHRVQWKQTGISGTEDRLMSRERQHWRANTRAMDGEECSSVVSGMQWGRRGGGLRSEHDRGVLKDRMVVRSYRVLGDVQG